MNRIIAVRPMGPYKAEQLNLLRQRVQEQLPEGYTAVSIPPEVELFEVTSKEPIQHTVAPELEYSLHGMNTTASPSGSEVVHANIDEPEQKIRFVWLTAAESTALQRASAVGEDDTGPVPKWGIEWDALTEQQKVQFADRVREL